MPTYEYECRECGHSFETVQNMSDDPIKDCPLCGKSVRRLIFGGSGVIFKGSGFYVNDAKGGKSSAAANNTKAEGNTASVADKPAAAESATPSVAASDTPKPSPAGSVKESA